MQTFHIVTIVAISACVISQNVAFGFVPTHRKAVVWPTARIGNAAINNPNQNQNQNQNQNTHEHQTNTGRKAVATENILVDDSAETTTYLDNGEAVVCARGVCVLADEDFVTDELCYLDEDEDGNLVGGMTCIESSDAKDANVFSFEYLWPRGLLLGCSLLYGTNFPLGRIMNDALPASATTSGRMLLAFAVLSPFLFQLKPHLGKEAVVGGSFCALGYLSQSIALVVRSRNCSSSYNDCGQLFITTNYFYHYLLFIIITTTYTITCFLFFSYRGMVADGGIVQGDMLGCCSGIDPETPVNAPTPPPAPPTTTEFPFTALPTAGGSSSASSIMTLSTIAAAVAVAALL